MIPFNKPAIAGREFEYIHDAVLRGKLSGNGHYTELCQTYFEHVYGFRKCLLTTSCTDALEMAAILADIQPGDEVIMPTFTFVSTANAFVLRGAIPVFVDSRADHPGMDEHSITHCITPKTKAIVVVHYAGVACDMDIVMEIAREHNLIVIEDAAQAIDATYKGKPLGSFGDFAAFSFHETKNISCGEGGMLVVNKPEYVKRAEIIREKGTNRTAFFRGEVDKYTWVDLGSSFLPSEMNAAFLYGQLEQKDTIQAQRKKNWQYYFDTLQQLPVELPKIPEYADNNAHMFYVLLQDQQQRQEVIDFLKKHQILSVFHYQCLHDSPFAKRYSDAKQYPHAKKYEACLLRLPLYFGLTMEESALVANKLTSFLGN